MFPFQITLEIPIFLEFVDMNLFNRIILESGRKRWGDMSFLLLCSDQLEAESRKGHVFAVGIASFKYSMTIEGFCFGNQFIFLVG